MVFTAADLAGVKPIRPLLHKFGYVPIEQPVLADGVVRYVGDPIAVAVADSDAEAEDLAERVEVEIARVPAVTDARDALAPGARAGAGGSAGQPRDRGARSATDGHAAAMARAASRVACTIRSRRQNASPLEPRAAHAAFDPADGRVTLTCTTQTPHMMRTIIADLLGMAEADLRVIAPDVGGGFGQKMSLAPEFVVLVWLARHLRASRRLDRGPAREPDGEFSCPRHAPLGRGRVRRGRAADRTVRRRDRQCRRLRALSQHRRGRAADVARRAARPVRCRRLCLPRARRPSPTPVAARRIAASRGRC